MGGRRHDWHDEGREPHARSPMLFVVVAGALLASLLGVHAVDGARTSGPGTAQVAAGASGGDVGILPDGADGADGAAGAGANDPPGFTSDAIAAVEPLTAIPAPLDVQPVLDRIGAAAGSYGVQLVGVSVSDLRSGARWSLNGAQKLSFMSSSKFPWVAIATSVAGVDAAQDDARAVFAWSDNDAAERLIELAGGLDAVNDWWYPALGMQSTCHQQWFDEYYSRTCAPPTGAPFDAAGIAFGNYSTADDMTEFLTRLWRGDFPGLTADERQAVLDWARLSPEELDPDGDGTLTGELPPAVRGDVYHKVGWDFDYLSAADVGIVDTAATTYAVSLAAFGGTDSPTQQQFLAWASCRVYVAMAADSTWTCNPTPDAEAATG